MKTPPKMDNLTKLQSRKAELKARIEQEREDIKNTILEIRAEIEPANLLKKALGGVLGLSKNKAGTDNAGSVGQLPAPLALAVDLLVKDPRLSLLVKWLTPLALKYLPKLVRAKKIDPANTSETPVSKPMKVKLYGKLRSGVTALRGRLRKTEIDPEPPVEQTEN